ncbi:MAG: response regulator transcription factor [Saprospiraceae bacterium]
MENNRILVVEDEPKVAAAIEQGLRENGFEVEVAHDGVMGKHLATTKHFDLVILDVNLPFLNGFEVCNAIREKDGYTPVIMLTAHGSIDEKMTGFSQGADDYVVKPFDFRELLARIRVFLKRKIENVVDNYQVLKVADLVMNIDTKTVSKRDKIIDLTAKEFALLEYLVRNKGKVLSKVDIAEKVWDMTFNTGTNVIEVYINFLRKKIDKGFEPKLIHTKPGMGYVLKAEIG